MLPSSRADEQSRKKDELANEKQRLEKSLITYQNDYNRRLDVLKQSRRYQQFLFKYSPTVIEHHCCRLIFYRVHRSCVGMAS
jgi:phage gp36-like protein